MSAMHYKILLKTAAAASLLALLSGCGGGAATMHYYNLPEFTGSDNTADAQQTSSGRTPLRISTVNLSSYLGGSGIVYQMSPVEYSEAQLNLWANGISEQLTTTLRQTLSHQLSTYSVLPEGADDSKANLLSVKLDQFQGRYDGQAVIHGSYQLYDDQQHLLLEQPISVSVALPEDGYAALVTALGNGWQQASGRISQALNDYGTHVKQTQLKSSLNIPSRQ